VINSCSCRVFAKKTPGLDAWRKGDEKNKYISNNFGPTNQKENLGEILI
jgi:hypothetical protein